MFDAAPAEIRQVLEALRRTPPAATGEQRWEGFPRDRWPALFRLLGLAADLPRLGQNASLARLPAQLWPQLAEVGGDLVRLQEMVDHPVPPAGAREPATHASADLTTAVDELHRRRCTTIDFLFEAAGRRAVEERVAALAGEHAGSWGQLERTDAPALFELFDGALGSERFHTLTGFEPARDAYSLTLSLQDLDHHGIGWHRDLYWPREWVGEDVFAVLYALGGDSPEKGGAFVYYVPWENQVYALFRKRHQTTVLWNGREDEQRPLHAVSGYLGEDTSRHLIILQCLRRSAT